LGRGTMREEAERIISVLTEARLHGIIYLNPALFLQAIRECAAANAAEIFLSVAAATSFGTDWIEVGKHKADVLPS